jgi:hypothetical protein
LADSDGDGVSDGQEVKEGRDPLIFGVGEERRIGILKEKESSILTLKEQRFALIGAGSNNFNSKLSEISKKNQQVVRGTDQKKNNRRSNNIKTDLNNAAKKIINHNNIDIDLEALFTKIALFFIPNSLDSANNLIKDFDFLGKEDLPVYADFNQGDKEQISILIKWYKELAVSLKGGDFRDIDAEVFINDLADNYQKISTVLKNILIEIEKGNRDVEKIDLLNQYAFYIKLELMIRKNINQFLEINNISFDDSEPGKMFVYSL